MDQEYLETKHKLKEFIIDLHPNLSNLGVFVFSKKEYYEVMISMNSYYRFWFNGRVENWNRNETFDWDEISIETFINTWRTECLKYLYL